MADKTHLEILGCGVDDWNRWREYNSNIRPDLSGADISHKNFERIDLRLANLERANISNANLFKCDLSGANLKYAELVNSNLSKADLHRADLSNSNIAGANLHRTNMRGSILRNSNLNKANLTGAYFDPAILNGADLSESILYRAIFVGARMIGANFHKSKLWETIFSDCDLEDATGLDDCEHYGPSTIDFRTINRTGAMPDRFLKGCGISDSLIDYLPSFIDQPIQLYSCFISYNHSDREFAKKLYSHLQRSGVRCWLDEHHMLPGDDIYEQIDRGIRSWDKVLLCCSKASLSSWWVDNEIDIAFSKERELMKERNKKILLLIPINLDNYIFSDQWVSGKRQQVRSRLAADFTKWETSQEEFSEKIKIIISALRTDIEAREIPPQQLL